jgi:hypothetical protein
LGKKAQGRFTKTYLGVHAPGPFEVDLGPSALEPEHLWVVVALALALDLGLVPPPEERHDEVRLDAGVSHGVERDLVHLHLEARLALPPHLVVVRRALGDLPEDVVDVDDAVLRFYKVIPYLTIR